MTVAKTFANSVPLRCSQRLLVSSENQKVVAPERGESAPTASPHENDFVAGPVLLTVEHHRRTLNQGFELLAGDVGINTVAQGLKLVFKPELDALAVEFGVGVRSIPESQETSWHGVVYLLRSPRGGQRRPYQPPILSRLDQTASRSRVPGRQRTW